MIRVLYMSDLHIEMDRRRYGIFSIFNRRGASEREPSLKNVPEPDLIVLAGDIHNALLSVAYADRLAKQFSVPVVLVAGNHEYYFQNISQALPQLKKAAAATEGRVRFLENERFTLEKGEARLHVLGCTLWTDFALHQTVPHSSAFADERMNDYRLINEGVQRLTTKSTIERHFASRAWLHTELEQLLAKDPGAARLIVTHHAPAEAFNGLRTGEIAPAYASDLLPEFADYAPGFWVHGHTHYRHETYSSGLWVVSAPRGYAREEEKNAPLYQPGILEI